MIIAVHVKKIKGLTKNFRKKKFQGEFVVFFFYKIEFPDYIIELRKNQCTQSKIIRRTYKWKF